jgi:hypothetical protein
MFHIGILKTIVLLLSKQGENSHEHSNAKRPLCKLSINLHAIVQHRHTSHNIIEHTQAKISVSALECQVSSRDTNDEVVDH